VLDLALFGYNLLVSTVGYGAFKLLQVSDGFKRDALFWKGRLGGYGPDHYDLKTGRPRFWFHAASIGEVTGAVATVHSLRRRCPASIIWLTVGTPQGLHFAHEQLGDIATVLPFPLDFPWVLKRAVQTLQPDLYVALESEFWPGLFGLLRQCRVPAVLLNGKLSRRSARRYACLRPLFQPIFQQFRWLAMHSPADREGALLLGAPPERVQVLGSAKYDCLLTRTLKGNQTDWRRILRLEPDTPVLMGGSLRRSECITLLHIFQQLGETVPQLVGIFAPRHLHRLPAMMEWLRERQVPFQLLSHLRRREQIREARVILVDQMGVLFDLYALGHLIFCGGTLEPIGGHNILEPVAWGKPVFYGPHLESVKEEHNLLQGAGGGRTVVDATALLQEWRHWVGNLPELMGYGEKAREAIQKLGGVAEKQVDLLMASLYGANRSK
jgi:3-deoxy-D-manno-octulosonic-acid transferase